MRTSESIPDDVPLEHSGRRGFKLGRVFLLLLIFGAALVAYYVGTRVPATMQLILSPGRLAFGDKSYINILCLGIDENWTRKNIMYTKAARSDTIFIVRAVSSGRSLKILSIPRDMRVYISRRYGYEKINSAHALGGVSLTKAALERFLGLRLDYYVVIKVRAAQRLVDALGGLEVDVEKDMDYDDNWGHLHIHLKKGRRRLNGEEAVGYARFRSDAEGDRGRIRRQQQVMEALARELKKPSTLTSIGPISKALKENLDTDLRTAQFIDLGKIYMGMERSGIKAATLRGDDTYIGGVYYMVAKDKEKAALLREFSSGEESVSPSQVRVEVLNGCGVGGLAAQAGEKLGALGYRIERTGNADSTRYEATRIVDHTGLPGAAAGMLVNLGKGEVISDPINRDYDITVILGKDFSLPGVVAPTARPSP